MEQDASGQEQEGTGQENLVLAAVGYLPMMFLLPLLAARSDRFARFHARQSLVLFVGFVGLWIAIWIVDIVFGRVMGSIVLLGFLFRALAWLVHNLFGAAVSLLYIAAMVAGLVNAALGRYWSIPVVGTYADKLAL